MIQETLVALQESIAHWERMKERSFVDPTFTEEPKSGDCALCKMFNSNPKVRCGAQLDKCPVYQKTGLTDCSGTPYFYGHLTWSICREDQAKGQNVSIEHLLDWQEAAQREIDFLRSLLPCLTSQSY